MTKLDIIKALLCETAEQPSSVPAFFTVGKAFFFRTVTYHLVGKIARIEGRFAILTDAAWVADSGRWSDAIANGTLKEVEPFPGEVALNLDTVTDACEWKHGLPLVTK